MKNKLLIALLALAAFVAAAEPKRLPHGYRIQQFKNIEHTFRFVDNEGRPSSYWGYGSADDAADEAWAHVEIKEQKVHGESGWHDIEVCSGDGVALTNNGRM